MGFFDKFRPLRGRNKSITPEISDELQAAASAELRQRLGDPSPNVGSVIQSAPLAPPGLAVKSEAIDIGEWDARYTPGLALYDAASTEDFEFFGPKVDKEIVEKAIDYTKMAMMERNDEAPKSIFWDPFALVEQLGYRDRPGATAYATLDAIIWRVPIIQAIIQTRINQVSVFCTPQRNKFDVGFRIKMRDRDAKPTPEDQKIIAQLENALFVGNAYGNDPRLHDNFEAANRKLVRDSLTYDQTCMETIEGRNGKPAEWFATDAATVRLANTTQLHPARDLDDIFAVQVYDNVVVEQYTRNELAWGIRNPRTAIRAYGYGTPEAEMIIQTITYVLWGFEYNSNFFKQGTVAKGLLNLKGHIPETQLRAFRRMFYQMIAGVQNAWRTPITNAEKLEWVNLHTSNRDMEFSAWMDFLIKVCCAVYSMDPSEINFRYGNSGGQKVAFEASNRQKIMDSRERGLKPLLRFLERFWNYNVVWRIDPRFELEFVGFDTQSPKELADLMTQRARTMYTINELRAEADMEPLKDGLGDILLDANWMNAWRETNAKKDQKEQMQKQEAELQAHAAAIASLPRSQVTDEELASVIKLLSQNPAETMQAQVPASAFKPGGPGGRGPGGGRQGTAPAVASGGAQSIPPSLSQASMGLPKPPNPLWASSGGKSMSKSTAGSAETILFDIEL